MSIKKYTAGTYNNDVHMFETEYGKYVKLEDHEEIVSLLQKEIGDLQYEIRNYEALWS